MTSSLTYYPNSDIHSKIKELESNSIDLIYTSPPYGTTSAKWDKSLDWEKLFPEMWRVLKTNGTIVLYASMPFTYELLQYEKPKYHYTWIKNNSTGFFQAKKQPLRNTEEIFVYYKKPNTYNPQMEGNKFFKKDYRKMKDKQEHFGKRNNIDKSFKTDTGGHTGYYPKTERHWKVLRSGTGITRDSEQMDFFIKTYTNENDTILDMTCCNKMCGRRAEELKRNYIGIDIREIPEI